MVQTLVVDDDRDTREVLRVVLEDSGYAVAEAADGIETLESLRTNSAAMVVLLDLDLPRLDGIGVLEAVAQDARLAARHAFVLLTAVQHSRYQMAEDICARLAVPLVLKPFDLDELLDTVAMLARRLPPAPSDPV